MSGLPYPMPSTLTRPDQIPSASHFVLVYATLRYVYVMACDGPQAERVAAYARAKGYRRVKVVTAKPLLSPRRRYKLTCELEFVRTIGGTPRRGVA